MATITIEVDNITDAAEACREVADRIEEGYRGGIVGWSGDTWNVTP